MPPPQESGNNWKRNFNFTHALFVMQQRGIVIVCRDKWGTQALGVPCALALVLMLLWWLATHDTGMLIWIGFWLLCFIRRRVEAVRLATRGTHSQYDGWPFDAIRFCQDERTAKLVVEPVLVGILGALLFWVYQETGWRPTGLPYFLLSGVVTLPFVQMVQQTIWRNRLRAMSDGKLEQQALAQDYRDQFGDS